MEDSDDKYETNEKMKMITIHRLLKQMKSFDNKFAHSMLLKGNMLNDQENPIVCKIQIFI